MDFCNRKREKARKHNPFDVVKVGQSLIFDYQTHLPQFFKNTAFSAIHMRDTHIRMSTLMKYG